MYQSFAFDLFERLVPELGNVAMKENFYLQLVPIDLLLEIGSECSGRLEIPVRLRNFRVNLQKLHFSLDSYKKNVVFFLAQRKKRNLVFASFLSPLPIENEKIFRIFLFPSG